MPWLADLVENSEGSFSVLPVQCLCEFLLNDALAGTDAEDQEQVSSGILTNIFALSLNIFCSGAVPGEEAEGWRAACPPPAAAAGPRQRGRNLPRDARLLPRQVSALHI